MEKLKQKIKDFLIYTQRYTHTDMIYLAKGGFWLTLGQIISTGASFLLAVAFANLLDPVTYGNYKYILSLVGILGIFSLPAMGTAIIQAVARGLEGSFYTAFKTKLKWGLLGSLTALGLASYYFLRGNYLLSIPLLISAIFLPLMEASRVWGSFLGGRKLFNIQVKFNSLNRILSVSIMITTLFLTKNLLWLIAVYFVSNTFLNFFFYLITKGKFQPNKKEDPQTLSYGKHLSLMGIIGTIANYLDRILIFHYLGAGEVAIYSFAIYPPEQIKGFFKNIRPLALPKLSQKSKQEIKKTFFKKIIKFFLALLPITVAYIITAPFLYKLIFPQYSQAVPYSQIFAISLIFTPILPISVLESQMAIKEKYTITLFSGFSRIFLMSSLVLFYGIWGVIIGWVLARFLTFLLALWSIKRL